MSSSEEDRAAELLERLLTDAEFRAAFRRSPSEACRAFDLPELANELSSGQGKALHTLEIRESRSSLAGALMAASSEGSGAVEHLRKLHESGGMSGSAHRVVHHALTSPKLAAIDPSHHGVSAGVPQPEAAPVSVPPAVAALLDNPRVTLTPEAHAVLAGGSADPRMVSVLGTLAKEHTLGVGSVVATDGAGGDSLEITSVDASRVSDSNIGARDLANELASLDPSLRPSQIVTPWPIDGPGFSTGAGGDDRIQLVFGTPAASTPEVQQVEVTGAQLSGSSSASGSPPEPSTPSTPAAPSTPSGSGSSTPDPTTPPPAPSTPAPSGSSSPDQTTPPATPSTPPPTPSTPPPEPSTPAPVHSISPDPTPAPSGSSSSPPEPSTPTTPATPPAPSGSGSSAADPTTPPAATSTPPPTPSTPTPAHDVTTPPPAASTPVPPTPAPAPSTPASVPSSPPPVAATPPPAPSHQSVVIEYAGSGAAHHATMGVPLVEHAAGSGNVGASFDPASLGLPDPSNGYPGDNAPKYEIAAWMARQAHLAGLPAELPIMAALTESSLHNDNYGDRDSLGYFQMRTSIWNQGEYAGFADHPELQLKWFINEALSVRKERIVQGDTTYGQDRNSWGNWVADVEQPAAEYRGRYQTHLDEADQLLQQASASGGASINPAPGSASAGIDPTQVASGGLGAGVAAAGGSPAGRAALAVAEKYLGTPYQWGGDTPQTGFDCSGLMEWSYSQIGIHLPRVAADQFDVGVPVTKADLKPGDLVFFQDSTGYIHHVGMYIGDDKFIEAPHTGADVRISSLDDPYYAQQFAGGRDMSGLAHGASPEPATPPAAGAAGAAAPSAEPPGGPADSGGGNTGVFGAPSDQPAGPKPPGTTVRVLPAVPDPNAPPAGS